MDDADELIALMEEELRLDNKSKGVNVYLPISGVTDPKELDLFSRFSKLKDNNNKPPQNIPDNDELLERLNRLKSPEFPPTPPPPSHKKLKKKKRENEMETSTEEELNKLWKEFNLDELNNNMDWTDSSDFSDPFDIISYTLG